MLEMEVRVPLLAVHVGRVAGIGPQGVPSGIDKRPLDARVLVTRQGLVGDAQADRRHHGGVDKALHHYPAEHYQVWRAALPARAARFVPGGFGENLVTRGLCEADVCLGDVFQLGSARVQISQGRQPCAKLNLRFELPDMIERVKANGLTGWYYRVLEEGETGAGDDLCLRERPHPNWPLTRVWRVLFGASADRAALAELAGSPVLAESWRQRAVARLA